MSPHLIIIASAMSLGGMASVGFNHYGEVQEQIASYAAGQAEQEHERGLAEFGDQMSERLAALEGTLEERLEQNKQGLNSEVAILVNHIEEMQSKQNSLEVVVGQVAQDQMEIEFVVETLGDSFVPLRSIESRFQPVNASERAHSLLPPLEGTWKEQF